MRGTDHRCFINLYPGEAHGLNSFVGLFCTGVRYGPDINVLFSKDLGPRCGSTVIWIYLLVGPWFCGVVCKPETPWAELDRLS